MQSAGATSLIYAFSQSQVIRKRLRWRGRIGSRVLPAPLALERLHAHVQVPPSWLGTWFTKEACSASHGSNSLPLNQHSSQAAAQLGCRATSSVRLRTAAASTSG